MLNDECLQQLVQRAHDVRLTVDLERAFLLDGADALFLHIAGHDAGKGTPQVGRQLMTRTIATDLPAHATRVDDEDERRRILGRVIEDFASRGVDRNLEEWVAGAPLFEVRFD